MRVVLKNSNFYKGWKFLFFFLAILFSCTSIFGQNQYLRLIEKEKYSKTEKKLNKAFIKSPDDVELNFSMAVLLYKRGYKGYSTEKSYRYVLKATSDFQKISDEKEIKKLNRIPINSSVLDCYLDTVCRIALEDAIVINKVESYENFLSYYLMSSANYKKFAIESRDVLAYKIALNENTEESFQYFITKYPDAVQKYEAIKKRNALAFEKAKAKDNIQSYKEFICKYPSANEVDKAWESVHEIAFLEAEKENTSYSYKKFIDEYPKSKQYANAFKLYEEKQFYENTKNGNWKSYCSFIEKYFNNSWVSASMDSIFNIAKLTQDIKALEYCVSNFTGIKRNNSLLLLHEVFTNDGEMKTLDLFYNNYDDAILTNLKVQDYQIAEMGDQLYLNLPFNASDFNKYDEYIKIAAPREKAFVALQRMLSRDIANKDWKSAIGKLNSYKGFFGTNNKKVNDLLAILESKWDNSIKISSVGNNVNNASSGEYAPVISADDKLLYFCGRDRKDNFGGEDIFVSNILNGNCGPAKIVSGLSSQSSNDAPLSISADGNMMLLFVSGKICFSEKTSNGWSEMYEFPPIINSANWQSDAMVTSDGKALLFASTRENGFNLYNTPEKYHGNNLYPSDIYISLINDNNEFGEPINLGRSINTAYCERMPFLHPDMKTLYFSSDGHGGLGKLDVFKTTRLADTCWDCWSEPINLGKEINTQESDAGYKISTAGDKAYFSFEKKSYSESSVLFLLDISSSMDGEKIDALKTAAVSVCQTAIENNSEVSILTFSGDCNNPIVDILPFTKDVSVVIPFVENLNSYGRTPMYEAYYYACEYMKKNSSNKSKNKVITLMTDGDANGCTTLPQIFNHISKFSVLYKTQTIAFDVSEYSTAYSDLQKIASHSRGKFYHSKGVDDLGSTFENANNDIFNINSSANNKDIYNFNIPPHLRPDFVATISGKLVDKNNQPISAEIRWEDLETGKNIGHSKSDPADGSFFVVLPLGKIYGYYVDKDEYFPISNNIDLRNNNKSSKIDKDISLVTFKQMIEDGTAVPVNNLFFNFAESELLPYSLPELKRVASIIKSNNLKVEISGHTDNIGDDKQNQILSEKRASAVKDYLVNEGCFQDNLAIIGFGKTKPVASNDSDEGRAKNRRVELKFIK